VIHLSEDDSQQYIIPPKHTGKEPIDDFQTELLDFWSWGYSDLWCNTTRSVFAEYIVGKVLGLTQDARVEWQGFDFEYVGSKLIEVKASSPFQSWKQNKLYSPHFDIKLRQKSWIPKEGKDRAIERRVANCYVFCIFGYGAKHLSERGNYDVLRLSDWRFFVLSTSRLEEEIGKRGIKKSISASTLKDICGDPLGHKDLKVAIHEALGLKK